MFVILRSRVVFMLAIGPAGGKAHPSPNLRWAPVSVLKRSQTCTYGPVPEFAKENRETPESAGAFQIGPNSEERLAEWKPRMACLSGSEGDMQPGGRTRGQRRKSHDKPLPSDFWACPQSDGLAPKVLVRTTGQRPHGGKALISQNGIRTKQLFSIWRDRFAKTPRFA
jgi:hypothetical protein